MKVLITTDLYAPAVNGVVTSVLNLRKELLRRGCDVKIMTLSDSLRSRRDGDVYYVGSVSARVIYPGVRVRTTLSKKIFRELIQWKPDVIHCQCEFSAFTFARKISRATGAPVVHTYHTMYEDYSHYFTKNPKLGRVFAAILSRKILNKCDAVIAPTEKVKNALLGYGVEKPIKVVPTGLDLERFRPPDPRAVQRLRGQLNIPAENKILIFVGRLAKEKNIEEIISYLSKLDDDKLTFLIAGDGPYLESLQNTAADFGVGSKIIFTGMIPPANIPLYYALGDVFVSASKSETQGLTYAEALLCGTPLLCKRDSALDGVLIEGQNGYLFDNFDDFSQKLYLCLRSKFSENVRDFATLKFSTSAFAEEVAAVYETV